MAAFYKLPIPCSEEPFFPKPPARFLTCGKERFFMFPAAPDGCKIKGSAE